jgi:competence protein ComEC
MLRFFASSVALALGTIACGAAIPPPVAPPPAPPPSTPPAASNTPAEARPAAAANATATCGGAPLTVHFFDVGQGLSALVKLPDGRSILVDAGESPKRPGCGAACEAWNTRLLAALPAALGSSKLDALWITHQHSDHLGGVPSVLETLSLGVYIDNGRDLAKAGIVSARAAATASGARFLVESPGNTTHPLPATAEVKLTPVLPAALAGDCSTNPNDCSIALRIDYCNSSMLFTGDAEDRLEELIEPGDVNLLQVGHHASETSTSVAFLNKTKPEYAVISSGKVGEGTNLGYCHPRKLAVAHLTTAMGGAGAKTVKAFDSEDGVVKCKNSTPANWDEVPANDNIWSTARDGDVVLVTRGDGKFERAGAGSSTPTPPACCKTCTNSKPCGDACIPKNNACTKAPGCACAAP